MTRAPLRIGILGAGTVGRAVVEGLAEGSSRLSVVAGRELCLAAVAVRDIAKARAARIPESVLTDAPAHVVADPDIDVIVELIGGLEPARTLIAAALSAGRPVVTANKAVIAAFGPELETIARRTGASLRFEAAVGGGIPVLGPLATDLAGNHVRRVRGIVNGTTNHILSAMAAEGRSYDEVLREAQELGYAEADPSGDVEGDDAANKLVILARLAFGRWIQPGAVVCRAPAIDGEARRGITGVAAEDMAAAARIGLAIKLLATAERREAEVAASVVPTAVPERSAMGATGGVLNRIEVDADPVGTVAFSGPGAGGAATSSAVLGDLVAVAQGMGSTWAGLPPAASAAEAGAADPFAQPRSWFARGTDGASIRADAASLADARRSLRGRADDAATLYPIDD
jgi:homoserine dehydrogenase